MKGYATKENVDAWRSFWRLMNEAGSSQLPTSVFMAERFFVEAIAEIEKVPASILDLGSGNGALSRLLAPHLDSRSKIVVLDASMDALKMSIENSDVIAVNARLENLPFKENAVDVVVSQFGVEYAGIPIWDQIGRIIKRHGHLCLLMHSEQGQIFADYQVNLGQIQVVTSSDFYKLLRASSLSNNSELDLGVRSTLSALVSTGQALKAQLIDGSMTFQLIDRLVVICSNELDGKTATGKTALLDWLCAAIVEIDAFGDRVQAMVNAALSKVEFIALQDTLMDLGFKLLKVGELKTERGESLGFKLHAVNNG